MNYLKSNLGSIKSPFILFNINIASIISREGRGDILIPYPKVPWKPKMAPKQREFGNSFPTRGTVCQSKETAGGKGGWNHVTLSRFVTLCAIA